MSKHKPTEFAPGHPPPERVEMETAKPQAEDAAKPQAADAAKPQAADAAKPQAEVGADENAAQLRAELEAAKDRALRCHAELENYRKRAARELDDRLRYANLGLLRDLLPVVDNVERAIAAAESVGPAVELSPQPGDNALLEGFKLVNRQLEDVLRRHHCHRIEALNMPFDPNLHHAIMQQPADQYPENTVLTVAQNGYQLHDRVVRPSQVIVSKAT